MPDMLIRNTRFISGCGIPYIKALYPWHHSVVPLAAKRSILDIRELHPERKALYPKHKVLHLSIRALRSPHQGIVSYIRWLHPAREV